MTTKKRRPSLTSVVTERVRRMIISGDIPLGATISERGISSLLKVSKTPVREALARLRHEGLVSILPQSGVKVFTLSAREVRAICAFRKVLERAALETAMTESRKGLLRDLTAIEKRMRDTLGKGNVRAYLKLDTEFHLAFFVHCGNPLLRSAYELYAGRIAALRTHLAKRPRHTALSIREHGAIIRALRAKDLPGLFRVLEDHINRTQETYEISIEDISLA